MYGRKTVFRAEKVASSADGKQMRIVRDVEGTHANFAPEDPEHIVRLSENQARRLRDSLNELLGDQ